MLYGSPRPQTDLEEWFTALKSWGVQRWMPMLNDFRNSAGGGSEHNGPAVPFLLDAVPEFHGELDLADEARKARHITRQADLCAQEGIDFWIGLPFPLFPSQEEATIRRALPDLYRDGHFNMQSPRVPEILQAELLALKRRIPSLKGVNLWLAEGAGGVSLSADDVALQKQWQTGILKAFNAAMRETGIDGILFAHNYDLTVAGRHDVYEMATHFRDITVMEDITWPEEDMLHPFLGYIPASDRDLLFRSNPVALNFLLDTEYLGQGVLPSVYPRWWKRNVMDSSAAGVRVAMGRTFFWDGGATDHNFNRLNAFIFTALCHNPAVNEKALLEQAVREAFGSKSSSELSELLWQTEPVIHDIIGINGIDPLSHSRFPPGETLDVLYTPRQQSMKAVSDLFQAPGTPLYPPLTGSLNNFKQWRWQNKIVSRSASQYLSVKQAAMRWTEGAVVQARQLAGDLSVEHRQLWIQGYESLNCLAHAMYIYVQAADLHHRWGHDKTMDDASAKGQFANLAHQCDELAEQGGANVLGYRSGLQAFANFLRYHLPRLGRPGSAPG
jgi:hypothetical protein